MERGHQMSYHTAWWVTTTAGQWSRAERRHTRVVRPVLDRGECWSHPTPPLPWEPRVTGDPANSRKDPFFPQISGCNLAPPGQGKKGQSRARQIWGGERKKTRIEIQVSVRRKSTGWGSGGIL